MRTNRKPMGGGAVAFIDVMACGLGAVVLLLVIVDFNIVEIIPTIKKQIVPIPSTEVSPADLEARLQSLKIKNAALADSIANLNVTYADQEFTLDRLRTAIDEPQDDPIQNPTSNKSGQLVGLQVDGASIIILLDSSASMFSATLAENVYYTVSPSKAQSDRSTKWSQARRIANWLIDVAPDSSKIKFASFSESVRVISKGWQTKNELKPLASSALTPLMPKQGTDLQRAFVWLSNNVSGSTQVFLITDGLPTKLSNQGLVSCLFSACARDPKGFVGGDCREQIFAKSAASVLGANVELNVILLPLEGDPSAAPQYWALARSKNGVLFTPEKNWP